MGRTAKHNWAKLFLEYCQGKYKSAKQFSEKKKLNYDQVKKEFRKLQNGTENGGKITPKNGGKKGQKKEGKKSPPKEKGQNNPWQTLKQQFTDWPPEKLEAYLVQIEARLAELKAIPDEELTQDEMKEIGQLRRERRAILSDPDPEQICTAHRQQDGEPCRNPAERGKKVCWVHGGAPGSGKGRGNLRHGLYAKILPDCEEFRDLVTDIEQATPMEKIDQAITLLQSQIAWSPRIMFVKGQDDIVQNLKRQKAGEKFVEEEWEFQYPWDRQASYLAALAKSATALEKLIARYEAMVTEEQKVKVEKLRQDMDISKERLKLEKAKSADNDPEAKDDGFIEALKAEAANVWADETDKAGGTDG